VTRYLTNSFICRFFIDGVGQALISCIAVLLCDSAVMYSYYRLKLVSTDTDKGLSTASICGHFLFFFLRNKGHLIYRSSAAWLCYVISYAWSSNISSVSRVNKFCPNLGNAGVKSSWYSVSYRPKGRAPTLLLTWQYFPMPCADYSYNWQIIPNLLPTLNLLPQCSEDLSLYKHNGQLILLHRCNIPHVNAERINRFT